MGGWVFQEGVKFCSSQMLVIPCKMTAGQMQNDGRTMRNVGRNTHNVYQGPKGGLKEGPREPPLSLYLKKL